VVFWDLARFVYGVHVTFDFVDINLAVKHVLDFLYCFDVFLGYETFKRTSEFSHRFRLLFLDRFHMWVTIIHF